MHDVVEAVAVRRSVARVWLAGSSPSRQPPNQPGYRHEDVDVGVDHVVVAVGAGAVRLVRDGELVVVVVVVVVVVDDSSRQPNQPGVMHVDVDRVDVLLVLPSPLLVDSSRQPHHPGILHVSVRVREDRDVEVLVGLLARVVVVVVVVVSVPLLSKYFHA